jgi:flavin reductase (DIM6/NTAB) family NADH-FMN oxidoreductase RutF
MDADTFREMLSHWAATVGILAVRGDDRIYGTTITSFTPVATDPPLVLVSLGPQAQALPFLAEGTEYAINLLDETQAGLAQVYADSFPVGPSPFAETGPPTIAGALVTLSCVVTQVVPIDGGGRLVLGRVTEGARAGGRRPLLWHRRASTRLTDDGAPGLD